MGDRGCARGFLAAESSGVPVGAGRAHRQTKALHPMGEALLCVLFHFSALRI